MAISVNLLVQYILVGIVLCATLVWCVMKIIGMKRDKRSSCCGCSLKDACRSKNSKNC
ncbi:MAG: hypothetical protein K2M10_10400 [Muribaculaceae bacterium]|nr:hypothetical protein [Muribaculaceae bacterium]MDE5975957.1 hypothetical protein [Muribaculaceae bacterium]MDE6300038.1 hypothetical protein [Muribaculaceae bacterium]